jgi:hypothetical protein
MVNGSCNHEDHGLLFTIYHSLLTSYGKEIIDREIRTEAEVCGACLYALQEMWPGTWLFAEV